MKIAHFFIDRPVFAAVISVIVTLLGVIAYPTLPVSQYPDIVPPTVNITAYYPGASAETLAEQVATPIEEQLNGVQDMMYMSSQSTGDGHITITCTFKLGSDLNIAQVLVQNRVQVAEPHLPQEVRDTGVTVRESLPDILLAVHMFSPDGSLSQQYVANYANLQVRDPLLRIDGVGDLTVRGARDYSIRVWIDPDRAAARSITVEDITQALQSHNLQVAAGTIGAPPFVGGGAAHQLNVQAMGRLSDPAQFADIIIKRDATGGVTRVGDVARVEMGAADYTIGAHLSEKTAAFMPIQPLPGSNALKTAEAVIATMKTLKKSFPPGLDYAIVYNPTEYVRASVEEVQKTLFEAMLLVVIVVVVFLQSWRAALIPILAIPISLTGSLFMMKVFGFSLNNLSLFGLVLAIGIVVDDAIVVVENVERHLADGLTPSEAAHRTMDEVGGALIAIALVLIAVFVPAAFVTGITGQFYRQFALTIATATVISLMVSLTLSPALAALLLKPHVHGDHAAPPWQRPFLAFGRVFNSRFEQLSGGYGALSRRLLQAIALMLAIYVGLLALTGWRLMATPGGFIPAQDQGVFLVAMQLPPGSTLQRTEQLSAQTVHDLLTVPGVSSASVQVGLDPTTGVTAADASQIYVVETPFADRLKKHIRVDKLMADLRKKLAHDIVGADIRVLPPPPVRGIGTTGGFKMIIEDRSGKGYAALEQAANAVTQAALKTGVIGNAFVSFNTKTPRVFADIDRDKAEVLGVSDSSVFDTLQTYLASSYIGDFTFLGRTFQVLAQADAPFRQDESGISELKTRSSSGQMVPLGSVISLKHAVGPYRVLRYNLYPAAEIQGEAAPGHSSGEALKDMEATANRVLPEGFGWEWTELAYQQQQASGSGGLVFVLAVVFVFLMLAALYESVTLPLAVILIVPMCLLAALTGLNLRGVDNNILTQVGFIVLIGLAAKNAILIVEFARQGELEHGLSPREAAAEAGRTRLRPILMTSFAFIFGVAPLAFAHGAGSEMRQALGTAVFFGMIGVTVFGLIFTPVFYVVCRAIAKRLPQPPRRPAAPPAAIVEDEA
jgi:HAE1 family hydrophobic/amphiphilic exporter-1